VRLAALALRSTIAVLSTTRRTWMRGMLRGWKLASLLAVASVAACSSATRAPVRPGVQPGTGQLPHSTADVQFMAGMIPHHAQAVLIAGWAASHEARSDIRILAERIIVAQRDEIALAQNWLRARNEPVPDSNDTPMKVTMGGVGHDMLMPGMLTADELAQLDRSRGAEFDRLFLTFMIRHHEGALAMVDQLFASYGAAQDEEVFRFASDVYADQSTEIERMEKMLADLPAAGRRP
jgi:uncharacterized protein (DUF305 family)